MLKLVVYQLHNLRWRWKVVDPGNGTTMAENKDPRGFKDIRDAKRSCAPLVTELIDGPHIERKKEDEE